MIDKENKLIGILTNRDLRFETDYEKKVEQLMTKMPLITVKKGTTLDDAEAIFKANKVENLPVVDEKIILRD